MKKMSRLLALVMALVLALGSVTTAMAEDSTGYALGDLTAGLLQGWSDAIWGHYANEFYNELKATTTEEEYNTVMASHSTAVAEKLISSMTEEQRADLFAHNVDLSAVNGEALTATAEDGGVVVDVPAGAFPTGTVANVAAVTDEASAKKIADAFANVDGFIPVAAYDFSFVYDFLGIAKEVQPAKAVPLIFEVDTSEFGEATSLQIYHMVENADGTLAAEAVGEAVEINTAKEKQTVSVSATSFSVYVLTVN